jgi:hypothetical protein
VLRVRPWAKRKRAPVRSRARVLAVSAAVVSRLAVGALAGGLRRFAGVRCNFGGVCFGGFWGDCVFAAVNFGGNFRVVFLRRCVCCGAGVVNLCGGIFDVIV